MTVISRTHQAVVHSLAWGLEREREEARSLVRRCFPGLGMSDEDLDRIVWCRMVMAIMAIMVCLNT